MTAVAPPGDEHAQRGANSDIVNVVAIVLAPGNGDQSGAEQRHHAEEGSWQIPFAVVMENVKLSRQPYSRKAQAGKSKGRVPGRERAPAVLEEMGVGVGGADGNVHGDVSRRVRAGLAPGEKIRARPADGVLDDIGDDGGEHEGDGEGEICRLMLLARDAPQRIHGNEEAQGNEECVDKVQG